MLCQILFHSAINEKTLVYYYLLNMFAKLEITAYTYVIVFVMYKLIAVMTLRRICHSLNVHDSDIIHICYK